ncbi:MAG: lipopolysaccharide biosynthesis protein [Bacteroidaceae bacterium]|nr:lipopolysaccharide biosynthesis protein [Bacteroidaceae bacterium]
MADSLKHKTVKGAFWSFAERFTAQGIHFLVMIIIARILSPKEFGLIGMLAIFMAVAQSLIDSGFSQALIRKLDRTEEDKNTVFYFNIVVSFILYLLFYSISPLVANFYNEPQLTAVMKVVCLVVVIDSFAVVQRALYTIKIDFKTQTKTTLIAAIASGAVGIYFAYTGYGVWALVYQQLVSSCVTVIFLWVYSGWYPKLMYSWHSFKGLFGFGSKLMISGLLDTLYRNVYQLIIGKAFSAESLGYYTNSHKFSDFPSSNLTTVLQRVTYPVLCTMQNEDERLAQTYRKFLRLSAFVIFPLMCGLSALAHPLIDTVLGEKWHYAAVLLVPLCFQMMWYPIHSINLNLLQVKGRSDLFLRLEIIKKVIGVSILFVSLPFGLLAMCYAGILSSLMSLAINTYYTGKLINAGLLVQMKDILTSLLLSLMMFVIVFGISSILKENVVKLLVGIPTGIIFFVSMALIFRMKELYYIKELIRN